MAEKNEKKELIEKTVDLKRVSKVTKGGRRFSFSSLVVVGDGMGQVGCGLGKANEVSEAIRKATEKAKHNMKHYSIYHNTIPHQANPRYGAAKLVMKPAPQGSGIISSSPVRAVIEAVGIRDINVKAIGSTNPHNLVKATLVGLQQMKSFEDVAEQRGKKLEDICLIGY